MISYDKLGLFVGVLTLIVTISIFFFQQHYSNEQQKKLEKLIVDISMNKQILTSFEK